MGEKVEYFDIKKLFKVLDANGWTEGRNFMKFWSEGKAVKANIDPIKKKSTIGVNINKGLRVYTIQWHWLNKFSSANIKYREFFNTSVDNQAVRRLLASKYGRLSNPKTMVSTFNGWLTDGLAPTKYLQYINDHQLQYIQVSPYELNGNKFNDLVSSLNGFNFFCIL